MEKKKEIESFVTISKNPSYDKHKCRTEGLDIDRVIKFNKGEKIQVSQKELDVIGLHRWLIVEKEKENVKQNIIKD